MIGFNDRGLVLDLVLTQRLGRVGTEKPGTVQKSRILGGPG